MRADEIMSKQPVTIKADLTCLHAAELMVENKISILPVVSAQEELVGVITQSDFVGRQVEVPHALVSIKTILGKNFYNRDIEEIYKESKETLVGDVMTKNVISVKPDQSVNTVVNLMIDHNLKRVPVVDDSGKLVGIITRRNLLEAFVKS
jgi:CBS domain-containing protein